jgi:hypothetical protein
MTSLVRWCANAGETYYILVHGAFSYEVGHFKIGYYHDDEPCNVAPDSVVIQPIARDSTGVADRVRLYWPPVPYAEGYNVYCDTVFSMCLLPACLLGTTTDTTYTDSLRAGVRYFYAVRTSNP